MERWRDGEMERWGDERTVWSKEYCMKFTFQTKEY
jgi:hypothetical protein